MVGREEGRGVAVALGEALVVMEMFGGYGGSINIHS